MSDTPAPKHMREKRISPRILCDAWWEANAPASWQGGDCPHGLEHALEKRFPGVSEMTVMPFPKQIKKTPFLEYLVEHHVELDTVRALVEEAERRYLAFTQRAIIGEVAEVRNVPEPYRVRWLGKSSQRGAYSQMGGYSEFYKRVPYHAVRPGAATHWISAGNPIGTTRNPAWADALQASNVRGLYVEYEFEYTKSYRNPFTDESHCALMGRLLEVAFPGENLRNPFEPLVDAWVRFGVMTASLSSCTVSHPHAPKPRSRLPLIGVVLPEEAYKLEGAPL